MPYVVAFVICENALIETDNVLSAVRIVDTATFGTDQVPPVGQSLVLSSLDMVLILKAGDARGERTFRLRLITPEPVEHYSETWTHIFTAPPESGQSMRLRPVSIVWAGEGLYYFEVVAENSVLARTPLHIKLAQAESEAGESKPLKRPL